MGSPVILPSGTSGLQAATEALTGFVAGKRQRDVEDQARQYQQGRDQRADMEADRTYGLQKETADANVKSQAQRDAIAAADEAFTRSMDGINRQIAAAQLKGAVTASQKAALDLAIAQATKGYSIALQKAGVSKAEADAKTAQITAQFAPEAERASINATNAGAAASSASANLENTEAAHYGQGGQGGGRGGRGTQEQQYDAALDALSPAAQEFYDSLYSTNNPPTRAQALLALRAIHARPGASHLTPSDYSNLETVITSRESAFVTPTGQTAAARADTRAATSAANQQYARGEKAFRDLTNRKRFHALPATYQSAVRTLMVDQNMSMPEVLQAVQGAASVPEAEKTQITQALTAP